MDAAVAAVDGASAAAAGAAIEVSTASPSPLAPPTASSDGAQPTAETAGSAAAAAAKTAAVPGAISAPLPSSSSAAEAPPQLPDDAPEPPRRMTSQRLRDLSSAVAGGAGALSDVLLQAPDADAAAERQSVSSSSTADATATAEPSSDAAASAAPERQLEALSAAPTTATVNSIVGAAGPLDEAAAGAVVDFSSASAFARLAPAIAATVLRAPLARRVRRSLSIRVSILDGQ
jgi:hypothetical protein